MCTCSCLTAVLCGLRSLEMTAKAPYARDWHDVAPFTTDDVHNLLQWRIYHECLDLARHITAETAVAAAAALPQAGAGGPKQAGELDQALANVLAESRRGGGARGAGGAPRLEWAVEALQEQVDYREALLADLERRNASKYSAIPRALRCRGNPARPLASHLRFAMSRQAARRGGGPDRVDM